MVGALLLAREVTFTGRGPRLFSLATTSLNSIAGTTELLERRHRIDS